MCAQPPALSTGKYTPPTFYPQTGNVGSGPMQSHVWTSSDRNGKSSKALEQGSGIIKCVFWKANRMKVARTLEAKATGTGLLRVH